MLCNSWICKDHEMVGQRKDNLQIEEVGFTWVFLVESVGCGVVKCVVCAFGGHLLSHRKSWIQCQTGALANGRCRYRVS